jgi:hypothetical protein
MTLLSQNDAAVDDSHPTPSSDKSNIAEIRSSGRRSFLGKLGTAATATMAAGVLGKARVAVAQSSATNGSTGASAPSFNARVAKSLALRVAAATADSLVAVPPHTTNGDENRYPDHSASYSKGLLQDDIGVVNPAAWSSFKKTLKSGKNSDFEAIIIGGTRTLNGPQGS